MRKLKLFVATSLDNFIARPDGGVDWLFSNGDYGTSQFLSTIDTALIGRKTYDAMQKLGDGKTRTNGIKQFVFTHKAKRSKAPHVEYVSQNVKAFVEKLKSGDGKDIWLMGGGEFSVLLLNAGLVDEIILSIHPILLGKGIALFKNMKSEVLLSPLKTVRYASGLIQISYQVV
jgi:dihydrofolate reductase